MFVHYRSEGLIIKKEDRGENDQLFTVYTRNFGKLEILGKAIRKISSKLRSGAEIFYLSEIEFIQGKGYKTLTDAILIEKFENLKRDLKKLRIAYKISEVLYNLIRGQEADEKIWQLLNEAFQKLNNWKPNTGARLDAGPEIIYYYFFWNFISLLGYQPGLYNCSICQKKLILEKLYFSPREGGIICQSCFTHQGFAKQSLGGSKKRKPIREIKPETIKILRIILKKKWDILSKIRTKEDDLELLESVSKDYLSNVLKMI